MVGLFEHWLLDLWAIVIGALVVAGVIVVACVAGLIWLFSSVLKGYD